MAKYNEDFIRNFFDKHNDTMEFLSITPPNKNRKRDVIWVCKICGEKQSSHINGKFFNRNYYMCRKCATKEANKTNLTIEDIRILVENNSNCILLSNEYTRAKDNLDFICECGNPFSTSYEQFKDNNKRQCNDCGYENGKNKNTINKEIIFRQIKDMLGEDFEILNKDDYKNKQTSLIILHKKCNHTFERTPQKIINEEQIGCGFCGFHAHTLTFESANYKLNEITNDFELISLHKKEDGDILLEIKRKECGCVLFRELSQIKKSQGAKCECMTQSISSKKVEEFLIENLIEYRKEEKFENCKFYKQLPFDYYLPKYNICIEVDGRQHDEIIPQWGGLEGFIDRKIRDTIKNIYCQQNDIKLIRIKEKDVKNNKYKTIIYEEIR